MTIKVVRKDIEGPSFIEFATKELGSRKYFKNMYLENGGIWIKIKKSPVLVANYDDYREAHEYHITITNEEHQSKIMVLAKLFDEFCTQQGQKVKIIIK